MTIDARTMTSPLDTLREKLRAHPELRWVDAPDSIVVKAQSPEGFDVSFFFDGEGYAVGYAGWHELFALSDADGASNCFAFGLSGEARLRVDRCGDLDYRWTLEWRDGESWRRESATTLLFFPFWRKKTVRYLRNPSFLAAAGSTHPFSAQGAL